MVKGTSPVKQSHFIPQLHICREIGVLPKQIFLCIEKKQLHLSCGYSFFEAAVPSIDNVQYVFEWLICPSAALKPLARHKALLHAFALPQAKDDDKEKWQNSRREACYTLSIEGIPPPNKFNRLPLPHVYFRYKLFVPFEPLKYILQPKFSSHRHLQIVPENLYYFSINIQQDFLENSKIKRIYNTVIVQISGFQAIFSRELLY